jgi:hypothetical protein
MVFANAHAALAFVFTLRYKAKMQKLPTAHKNTRQKKQSEAMLT